jgi:glycosyltransferase involved in cell wall biosynthesis
MGTQADFRLLVVGACRRDTGGVSQYVNGLVCHLDEEVVVEPHSTSSPPGKSATDDGVLRKYRWVARAVVSAVWTFLRFTRRSSPDVVHVHASSRLSFYRESLYVVYAALVWRRPVLLHVHGSDFDAFLRECGPVRSWYVRRVMGLCDSVVALSSYWADVIEAETGIEHTAVVPNPVDSESFPDGDGDGVHVVYVSNLIERKGVAEFATAVRRVADRAGPEFEVSVAGEGPEADRVEKLAADLDAVTYHGYVSEERKRELLGSGSIYVLPSYAEGLPIALLEGMAGGNAVVSTTVGAIPEVVDEESGILIPPVDVDELTAALEELRRADERRRAMARRNRKLVRSEYTWDRVTDALRAEYDRVRRDHGPTASPGPTPGSGTLGDGESGR